MNRFVNVCVAFGLQPYKVDKLGLVVSRRNAVVSIALVLVSFACLILQANVTVERSEFREWVYFTRQIIYRVFCLIYQMLYLKNSKQTYQIYLDLKVIANKLKLDLNQKSLRCLIVMQVVIYISTIFHMYLLTLWGLYIHIQTKFAHSLRDNILHLLHYVTNSIIYLIELVFINLMILLSIVINRVNLDILRLKRRKSGDDLRRFLNFSAKLEEIATEINEIFSFQLLLSMLVIFIEVTFSIYFITITIFDFNTDSIGVKIYTLYLMPWVLLLCIKLFAINSVCTLVETQARFTAVAVHKLFLKQNCLNEVFVEIVQNYSIHSKLYPIYFTAKNFFKLETGFTLQMISSVITYLLILVNFNYMNR